MTSRRAAARCLLGPLGLLLALVWALALSLGLAWLWARLFSAWGVGAATVLRAPAWARFAYAYASELSALLVLLSLWPAAHALSRLLLRRPLPPGRFDGRAALCGAACGLVAWAALLAPDLVRLARSTPVCSAAALLCALLCAAAALGLSALCLGFAQEAAATYPRLARLARLALCAVPLALILGRGLNGWAYANALLAALVAVGGGYRRGASFLGGLALALYPLLGCDGAPLPGLFESYGRALPWLSGGASGIAGSPALTLALLSALWLRARSQGYAAAFRRRRP